MQEQTIFDLLYPKFKFTKPIRLIELFAGYGSQALALKYLGVKFEHWKICEWAVKSIQAYKDIHFNDDNEDYSKNVDYKTICSILKTKGISSNYNEPMSMQQITRLSEKQVRKIYSNIIATNNLVNIQQVNGRDLSIVDTDKYDYVLTYSFPCQDLSLAGKGKGMSDTSTRSGMLWEVERILTECKELGSMPQVLLMENVPQVHSEDNKEDFKKWIMRLEELGYSNYWQDLIATDYGIPQTRNRCFMVSLLGDYSYSFAPRQPLTISLRDMLEPNVNAKYFLSDKLIEFFYSNSEKQKENGNGFRFKPMTIDEADVCKTITTSSGNRMDDNFIINKPEVLGGIGEKKSNGGTQWYQQDRIYDDNVAIAVTTSFNPYYKNDLRIRKLTPKECFRLMGVRDDDFDNCAKNQSNASLYHLAGDSIVVNVLMAIFKEML